MFLTLYKLSSVGLLGWLLLIAFPTSRASRWIADRAVFPLFISVLYVAGLVPLLMKEPGAVVDFTSAEGVIHLLSQPNAALVLWIHVIAFDQAVALMIYRDNMQHRWVSLPVQSVILVLTLMFGPGGYLAYTALRGLNRGRAGAHAPASTGPATALPVAGGAA